MTRPDSLMLRSAGGAGRLRHLLAITIAGLLAAVQPSPLPAAEGNPRQPACPAVTERLLTAQPMPRTTAALTTRRSLRVVAMGSSSTAGAGASSVGQTYPSRLGVELLRRWPGARIEVINVGINGEEIADMLPRLQRDVFDRDPDLLLWQFGSNALLRRMPVQAIERAAREGIDRVRRHGIDMVLIDLQHAPRIDAMADRDAMLSMISGLGHSERVPVFHRYRMMRDWASQPEARHPGMLHPDGLHMNDRSYGCLARELAAALTQTIRQQAAAIR